MDVRQGGVTPAQGELDKVTGGLLAGLVGERKQLVGLGYESVGFGATSAKVAENREFKRCLPARGEALLLLRLLDWDRLINVGTEESRPFLGRVFQETSATRDIFFVEARARHVLERC